MDNRIGLPRARVLLVIAGARLASHKTEGGSNYARGMRRGALRKPMAYGYDQAPGSLCAAGRLIKPSQATSSLRQFDVTSESDGT
ncbi:MAG TPA: hypothetical protein VF534_14320, partial [Paraburkholderia sp.]